MCLLRVRYGNYSRSYVCFFFSSRRRHTRCGRDWSSDVCSSDLAMFKPGATIDDSWAFAVEGPDGTPGTGDEANIASNSWGWTDQPASGWEYYSRLKYYLNTVYAPGTVFVQSTGNEGPGYATEASPTASSSIQAGAATSTDVFWLFQALGAGLGDGRWGPTCFGDCIVTSA